ncbi:MAG: transcriptional regulator [Planctomycetota bacterium]
MPPRARKASIKTASIPAKGEGRFSYEGLDRILHEKARLGILASLASNPQGILFNDLKRLCSLTDGNLSRHLGVLSDAGLVEIWKGNSGSRPQTMYRLTTMGRKKFTEYISVLEGIVADAQALHQADLSMDDPKFSGGWSPA